MQATKQSHDRRRLVNADDMLKVRTGNGGSVLDIAPSWTLYVWTDVDIPQQGSIIKGDAQSLSIAAASIVAKVTRDRIMVAYHEPVPRHYGFDSNKGYGKALRLTMRDCKQTGRDAHTRKDLFKESIVSYRRRRTKWNLKATFEIAQECEKKQITEIAEVGRDRREIPGAVREVQGKSRLLISSEVKSR